MTDWDQIAEYIHNAMQAVDQAQAAGENLRNDTSQETLDAFKLQMEALGEHLIALKNVIEHTSTFSMDELVDVLSKMYNCKPAAYRRTQHIEP